MATADGVSNVIDGLPLIQKATELKEEGNGKHKQKLYNEAAAHYERGIAVLDKADGQPMLRQEVDDMVALKATLYCNVAQCMLSLELYRRAIDAATACLNLDEKNAKALHRRSRAHEALQHNKQALADAVAMQQSGGGPMKKEELEARLEALREKVAAEEKAKADESSEDDADTDLVNIKKRFDEVVEKYDLRDDAAAGEVADWLVSGEWLLTVKKVAERWKMENEDAEDFLKWIARGVEFQAQNSEAANAASVAQKMQVD